MKTIRISSLLFLSLLLLYGCDPELQHESVLENTSGYDFWVINERVTPQDSILLLDGTEEVIWSYWGIGTVSDFEDCSQENGGTFSIIPKDRIALEVLKDLNDGTDWEHSILDQGSFGSGSTECRMVLGPEDVIF